MPPTPWDVASLPPKVADRYVRLLVRVPQAADDQDEVYACASSLPAVAWVERPYPLEVLPGSLLILRGQVTIPYAAAEGAPFKVVGLLVQHGDPPDMLLTWGLLEASLCLCAEGEALSAELEVSISKQPEVPHVIVGGI